MTTFGSVATRAQDRQRTASLRRLAGGAALALACTAAAPSARAQTVVDLDAPRPARFFAGIGLTGGGDRLYTARYSDGTTQTLRAGGLFQLYGGVEFRVARGVSLAVSAGYHVDSASARNGSVWFGRVPIELLGHVQVAPYWRVGGGLRVATNPTLRSDRDAAGVDEDFHTAVGPVLEIEHTFNPWLGLKLRGVAERYKSRVGLPTANGNHVGLLVTFYF